MQLLSFETRYPRFMSAVKELSPQTVDRLTQIDHRRDAALIALVKEQGTERSRCRPIHAG
jgi:acetyltransferase